MQSIHSRLAATLALAAFASGCAMTAGSGGAQQVALSGQEEVPPAASAASGSGTVTVSGDCMVSARVTVSGMTATAAHIHQGKRGANGPVIVPFTKSAENTFVAPDGAKMNEAQCAAYKAGDTYVNVHSDKFKGGEVRGQLKGS
jgi:hypothetical protein